MNFEHFLITRFNVPVPFAPPDVGLDPDWLKHRLDLFKRFCAPSVAGQTAKAFTWLIVLDSQTPTSFLHQLKQITAAEHVFAAKDEPWHEPVRRRVRRAQTSSVLTTRLDNDDAIHRNFINTVQIEVYAHPDDRFFIEMTKGFSFDLSSKSLRQKEYPGNPFISLVEKKIDDLDTVYCGDHIELLAQAECAFSISSPPLWLQVIHDRNVFNKHKGIEIENVAEVFSEFSLKDAQT